VRREKTSYVIQAVAHALDVIEQFGSDREELGVTDLSKRLKLHKNNVFRLLATLEARGYVEQNKATENYRLGVRCLQLGQRFAVQLGLLRQAEPVLAELAKSMRETAVLAVHRSPGMIPLAAADGGQPVRAVVQIGEPMPLHCTAVGKAHLAFFAGEDLPQRVPAALPAHTSRTITDQQRFIAEIEATTRRGYAVEVGEFIEDVHAVAVPVRDYTGAVVACLGLTGPAHRLPSDAIESSLAPAVARAGEELSRRLGYQP